MSAAVYVTGMAVWSPFGRGTACFWDALVRGDCAAREVHRFATDHWVYRTRSGAIIPDVEPEANGADEESARQIIDAVTADLIEDARLSAGDDLSPYRSGVFVGSSQNVNRVFREHLRWTRGENGTLDLRHEHVSLTPARMLHRIAAAVGARGSIGLVSTACASGTSSVGVAYEHIRHGRLERAIAGGIGHFSELSFSGFNILRLTARKACRPFDQEREGMILGDAYALIALESADLVSRRGAQPVARVIGYASGNEAFHPTAPQPDGGPAHEVMWAALNRSSETLARLDYINAHGTGTPANDRSELAAIDRLLRARGEPGRVAINSTKGHHGHALGAAGSIELIATLLTMQHRIVPPTVGLASPEPGFEQLCLVYGEPRRHDIRVALSNSFAFGGNVASIALEAV